MRTKAYYQTGKETLEVLEFAKNYNAWIASKLLPYLTDPVLEIGAGTGNITKHIVSAHASMHVTDADTSLVTLLKHRFHHFPEISVRPLDIEKKAPMAYNKYFSSIYAVNVLEHIKDDWKALEHMRNMLRLKGKLVIFVPAKKFAFTSLDRELGHFRRYEKQELVEKLKTGGFTVETIEFFNCVGIISWFLRDTFYRGDTRLTSGQIALFEGIIPVLKFSEATLPVPVGISLIAVAKAP